MGLPAEGVVIRSAQISDPFVLLQLSNGLALLLEANIDTMTLDLAQGAAEQLFTRALDDPSAASLVS